LRDIGIKRSADVNRALSHGGSHILFADYNQEECDMPPVGRAKREDRRLLYIPTGMILPNPSQPRTRFDGESLGELADSISRYGVLQPLSVRRVSTGYELVAGERRLRAAKLAGLESVPCIVLDAGCEDSSVLALVENLQRCDLDFVEEAEGIALLIKTYGMSQEEAARKIGKSQSAVANKLRLLRLSPELLRVLREAGLTERHARALLRLSDDEARLGALGRIVSEKMTVSRAESFIASLAEKEEKTPKNHAGSKEEKQRAQARYVIKDVRLFLNTVSRYTGILRSSGVKAVEERCDTEREIVLKITIPK